MKKMTNQYKKDDDPVAKRLQDNEDEKVKEAKEEYGRKNKTASFSQDFLCDKNDNGHN